MAIEQQMEMFGKRDMGKLDDDGLKVDPVSGNPIPPGSMAKEVRDDVEARLSDGEYVVPANVVRFFGVKFFEDLRNKAMKGLADMDKAGRIGGEPTSTPTPVAMPMQDQMADVKPDINNNEMEMLKGLMNEGGVVRQYQTGGDNTTYASTAYNPLQYPLTQYATPGASVYNPNLNPNVQALEQTQTAAPTPAGSESTFVTFVNPATGALQVLQYIGGEPANIEAYNALINQGFFIQDSEELAAYKQRKEQDEMYDPAEGVRPTPMGADPEELVNIILESGGMELPGLGSKILSGVMGGSKVYQNDIDAALEHIIDKGTRSVGQNALRDAAGNIVFHTEGPLKGKVMREQEKVSPEMVAYLTQIKEIRDGAKKDGVFDKTLFRDNMITKGLLTKEESFLGSRYKTLTEDQINTEFKSTDPIAPDTKKDTTPKPKPATAIPDVTSADKPYVPPTRPTFKPDRNDPSIDGPLVDAGGLTQSQREEQYRQQDKETSATGVAERLAARAKSHGGAAQSRRGFNKGGLLKKPTKKKTKTKK